MFSTASLSVRSPSQMDLLAAVVVQVGPSPDLVAFLRDDVAELVNGRTRELLAESDEASR